MKMTVTWECSNSCGQGIIPLCLGKTVVAQPLGNSFTLLSPWYSVIHGEFPFVYGILEICDLIVGILAALLEVVFALR